MNAKSARGHANSMTSNAKNRSNSTNIAPIEEDGGESRDNLEDDDDDIQRTPEVINLHEIKANNEEAKKSLKTAK